MLKLHTLLALLLSASIAGAQNVPTDKIEIEGKHTAAVGYMTKLKIVKLPGDDVKIRCSPANDDWFAGSDFDGNKFVVFVPGLKTLKDKEKSKLFTFTFASNKDKKTLLEIFEVTVTADGEPVVSPPPGTGPPDEEPPVVLPPTDDKFFYLLVRPNTNASPAYSAIVALDAWDTLREQGHRVGEMTLAQAKANGAKFKTDPTTEVVVKLRLSADGKKATQVGQPLAFPKNDAEILALAPPKK